MTERMRYIHKCYDDVVQLKRMFVVLYIRVWTFSVNLLVWVFSVIAGKVVFYTTAINHDINSCSISLCYTCGKFTNKNMKL